MNCLSQKQITEYLHGNKSEAVDLHLAQCKDCRTALLKLNAEKTERFSVSAELTENTLQKIRSQCSQMKKPNEDAPQVRRFPSRYFFALAAAFVVIISGLVFFTSMIRAQRAPFVVNPVPAAVISSMNVIDSSSGSISQAMKVWLDTAKMKNLKDAKKQRIIRQETGTTIRLGKKTGILTEPTTVLQISDRTDTSVFVELKRGKALFTVEKNRYRLFYVTTPDVRIRVTGTVFSVFVDSAMTKVNVLEGAVQLTPTVKTDFDRTLEQGDEAIANKDSIAATEIMNRLTAKKRGSLLMDYLQSTVFSEDIFRR